MTLLWLTSCEVKKPQSSKYTEADSESKHFCYGYSDTFFFPCIEASVTGNGFENFYECSEIKAWGTELVVQIIFSWAFSGIRIYELLGSTDKNTPCEQFQCLYFSTTNSISWKESRSIVLRSRSDVKDLMSQFCSNKLKLVRKMFDLIHTCWVFLQSLQESFPVFCQDIHPWVHQTN